MLLKSDMKVTFLGSEIRVRAVETLEKALREGAEFIAQEAKAHHPYKDRTGRNTRRIAAGGKGLFTHVRTRSGYGAFLEFGTARNAPYPYLRPAFDAKRDEVLKKIKVTAR